MDMENVTFHGWVDMDRCIDMEKSTFGWIDGDICKM